MSLPEIIQGGMGVGVSNWKLARAVSSMGGLGVVSATGLDIVFLRRLQDGDRDHSMRDAMAKFPIPGIADRFLKKYFREGGRTNSEPYRLAPMESIDSGEDHEDLLMLASFVEVTLAKSGHSREVGINYLEKIQLPTLPSLYGAVLANVDYVLMGAGIPRAIPGVLDKLSMNEETHLKLDVHGANAGELFFSSFNPKRLFANKLPELKRPRFLGIITSHVLAQNLATKADGHVDGFVIEGAMAGGHNAPPRGPLTLDANGEPVYGPRDLPDLGKIRAIGRPFWLAGWYGTPDGISRAKAEGAEGVQVGTPFAFCEESGITPSIKTSVIDMCRKKLARVFTDAKASPTGFPFKVLRMPGTVSEEANYNARKRICDLGYLRQLFRKDDGTVGYRCSAEPVDAYLKKGGCVEDTVGRKCLCNGLLATIGLGQPRKDSPDEAPIVTVGDCVTEVVAKIAGERESYSAADVINYMRGVFKGATA
jgi:nitronate monooxygenase